MPMTHLHLKTVLALLKEARLPDLAKLYGVSDEDLRRARSHLPWTAVDRPSVRRTLDAMLYGGLDAMGIQHFPLSAEFIAAWIATCVHPINDAVACSWYGGCAQVSSLAADPEDIPVREGVTPERLHALVHALRNTDDHHTIWQMVAASIQTEEQIANA